MATVRKTSQPAIAVTTDNGALTLTFADGQQLTIAPSELSAEIRQQALLHGLKQKLVDAAAIPCDTTTGKPATIEQKFAAVKAVHDRLLAGEWNQRAAGGAGGSKGLLQAALERLYPSKDIAAWLDRLDDKQKAALRASAAVAPIIETIKAERAARKPDVAAIDADAMLKELAD